MNRSMSLRGTLMQMLMVAKMPTQQSLTPEPNRSGEIVERTGFTLWTLNSGNLLYVMWRITQPEGLEVKLKHNPGQNLTAPRESRVH